MAESRQQIRCLTHAGETPDVRAVLHGEFTAAELADLLRRMRELGASDGEVMINKYDFRKGL